MFGTSNEPYFETNSYSSNDIKDSNKGAPYFFFSPCSPHNVTDESVTVLDDSSSDDYYKEAPRKNQGESMIPSMEIKDSKLFMKVLNGIPEIIPEEVSLKESSEINNLELESFPEVPRETLMKSSIKSPMSLTIFQNTMNLLKESQSKSLVQFCNASLEENKSKPLKKLKMNNKTQYHAKCKTKRDEDTKAMNNRLQEKFDELNVNYLKLKDKFIEELKKSQSLEMQCNSYKKEIANLGIMYNKSKVIAKTLSNDLKKYEHQAKTLLKENNKLKIELQNINIELFQLKDEKIKESYKININKSLHNKKFSNTETSLEMISARTSPLNDGSTCTPIQKDLKLNISKLFINHRQNKRI